MSPPPLDAQSVYAASALRSLPRLLSLLDRNPLSPTCGCFHRDYWLYKTSDFPDAVRQFSVHALALAYTFDVRPYTLHPTPYTLYQNETLRDWTVAALLFWAKIQHADGSFDEFYPYERGWVGPTAFTTYAAAAAYALLRDELQQTSEVCKLQTSEVCHRVEAAIRRAAQFIAAGETERDDLANHHAMAALAVHTAAELLNDATLRAAARERFRVFLTYHHPEGWSREYDGADPGYLSATVSFLAKVYRSLANPTVFASPAPAGRGWAKQTPGPPAGEIATPRRGGAREDDFRRQLRDVLQQAVEFCSYFVYPNGSYGGTIGSRNTLHFYPHGFELLAPEMPLAAAIADRLARALAEGQLVPPEIMSDRYVHYRVPEYLLAARDARPRPAVLTQLPYERPAFARVFLAAGLAVARHGTAYTVASLHKGGTFKTFDVPTAKLLQADTGWAGVLADGRLVTSQWIPRPNLPTPGVGHLSTPGGGSASWISAGTLQLVPPPKLFTPWKNVLFRTVLSLTGWYPPAAHRLKGLIRKTLILGSAGVPCRFHRAIHLRDDVLEISDRLENHGRLRFRRLLLGGDLHLRYVPQSRFFQFDDLAARPVELDAAQLAQVNRGEPLAITRTVSLPSGVRGQGSGVAEVAEPGRTRAATQQ